MINKRLATIGPLAIEQRTTTGYSSLSGGVASGRHSFHVSGYQPDGTWVSEAFATLLEARCFAKQQVSK